MLNFSFGAGSALRIRVVSDSTKICGSKVSVANSWQMFSAKSTKKFGR
jgi:hypothetical protein